MKAIRIWLMHLFEWLLLGFGLGCLGMYAYETVERAVSRPNRRRRRARRQGGADADVFAAG